MYQDYCLQMRRSLVIVLLFIVICTCIAMVLLHLAESKVSETLHYFSFSIYFLPHTIEKPFFGRYIEITFSIHSLSFF